MTPADLRVVDVSADAGHVYKRYRSQGRGRINPIIKRSTHIMVSVSEEEK
jgi:ribosomal protein L22